MNNLGLFINGSPDKNGNTAALAAALLNGREYETLNLTDYRIGSYGQKFGDDQLDEVIAKMKEAETIVIGSPLYWHNMSARDNPAEENIFRQLRLNQWVKQSTRWMQIPGRERWGKVV